ncbi:MAG: hypothetical protein IJ083_01760 [Clostridia bacterium]|nr:hypothetical protein [Clostridia bacterium]
MYVGSLALVLAADQLRRIALGPVRVGSCTFLKATGQLSADTFFRVGMGTFTHFKTAHQDLAVAALCVHMAGPFLFPADEVSLDPCIACFRMFVALCAVLVAGQHQLPRIARIGVDMSALAFLKAACDLVLVAAVGVPVARILREATCVGLTVAGICMHVP